MNVKNEITNKPTITRPNIFRITDSEVYMIKDTNLRRIHDILKNSYTAKPNEECNVNPPNTDSHRSRNGRKQ
jgi:hypothetical protein